jgi:hypothetical protein
MYVCKYVCMYVCIHKVSRKLSLMTFPIASSTATIRRKKEPACIYIYKFPLGRPRPCDGVLLPAGLVSDTKV